ncbi:DUF1774-domain-containing protein [Patellaria atrata CBS 101060]|uniref:DUF1774-domain-containing protein n=1 Tax=Patellaria atrata CBS 101060 TaxID=1346257 RepID=A0A9P4S4J1_9PEZI|nr:DUF1774-domain-containing protein [Patellaria atrata CBS 101060]
MPENETLDRVHDVNPFKSRDEHTRNHVVALKIGTVISWLIVVVTALYYEFNAPHTGKHSRHKIWHQPHTPFAMNSIITSLYWLALFIMQIGYVWHLYSSNTTYVTAAANVGSHFIAHNLLLMGIIHLWVRSHYWLAELLVIINFFNLSAAYFRHSTTPRFIHIPVVSGPLAWNFVALYWVGAAAVHAHSLPARIVANIFIWGIFVYGGFFLSAYKDYTMGFELSILSAAIGVTQFLHKIIAFQWIFAFVIMAVLFLASVGVSTGRGPFKSGEIVSEDRERAPLLDDQ